MDSGVVAGVFIAGVIIVAGIKAGNSPEAKARREADAQAQKQIVCPHCNSKGGVTRTAVTKKQGVSGGKATGAVLTGGLSLFATGLSRKQGMTQMACSNCGTKWLVA